MKSVRDWILSGLAAMLLWVTLNAAFAKTYYALYESQLNGQRIFWENVEENSGFLRFFYYSVSIGATIGDTSIKPVDAVPQYIVSFHAVTSVYMLVVVLPMIVGWFKQQT